MGALSQDLKYGVRALAKNPGFTAVAVLTLALGIGANTAIFSVVNAVLLRPLPYKDPAQLVQIWESNPKRGFPEFSVSPANFLDWRAQNHSFQAVAAVQGSAYTLTGAGTPERIQAADVSPALFGMLGVQPALGRILQPSDENPANAPVAAISYALWQGKLGADPNVVGRTLTLDGKPRTIVGVMPASFHYPSDEEQIWTPLILDEKTRAIRGGHWLSVLARLRSGLSLEQGEAEMKTIAAQLESQYPGTNQGWTAFLRPLHKELVGDLETPLLVLLGAVGLVLLIACANVANLQLARTSVRMREMAIRAALGAGRRRIVRQLLTESLLLALAGTAFGVLLAWLGTGALLVLDKTGIPRQSEIGINGYVLAFAVGIALITALLFGLAPALQSSSLDLTNGLKNGSRGGGQAASGGRLRRLLVVAEVALALILLIGGGLLVRSFVRLVNVAPGFHPENTLTFRVELPEARYPKKEDRTAFFQKLVALVQRIPGVESVGGVSFLPLSHARYNLQFYPEGHKPESQLQSTSAEYRVVTPDYFRAMGIPLVRGRVFTDFDGTSSPRVALINQAMALRFWPNDDPVGKKIVMTDSVEEPREIVGIVGDVRQFSLERSVKPEMYVPQNQLGWDALAIVTRSRIASTSLASAIRERVHSLDGDLPVYAVHTVQEVVDESVGDKRFSTYLFTLFSILALALAAIGIYGVTSYTVAQGTREIGIRMALGAKPADVLRLVLGAGMRRVLIGIAIGMAGALVLARYLASLLFGVSTRDPLTFVLTAFVLVAVALVACYVPTRRAMRVDPIVALRYE